MLGNICRQWQRRAAMRQLSAPGHVVSAPVHARRHALQSWAEATPGGEEEPLRVLEAEAGRPNWSCAQAMGGCAENRDDGSGAGKFAGPRLGSGDGGAVSGRDGRCPDRRRHARSAVRLATTSALASSIKPLASISPAIAAAK